MAAFTHLCNKVNISLAHNTVTIYSKNNRELFISSHFFNKRNLNLTSVLRESADHDYFHDDKFDKESMHYHLKFSFKMNEQKLSEILSVLIEINLISAAEKQRFLATYQIVNNAALERFNTQLVQLQQKAVFFTNKAKDNPEKYGKAAVAANQLYASLEHEAKEYMKDRNLLSYERFQANCNKAIEKHRPILEEHRGCAKLLGNIAAAIVGLGVIYLIAASINYYQTDGKHFFFQFKTDSIEKLEQFQEAKAGLLRT